MADIRSWSTTAASNNSSPPDGWPEGQAPSTVNNSARENMRAIKKQWSQGEWFSHGDDVDTSIIRKDGTNISLSGTHTATYHVGRRLRARDTAGDLYGTIEAVTFSGGTQVTMNWDTGSLTATVTAVELALLSKTNPSSPPQLTTIELGHASDTTIARASAGEISVEGTQLAKLDGNLQDLDTLGAASSDGEFAVATGAGALAWESGATLRTSVGVGTGDSPQFTGIELGHATDTTIARASAGEISVEGAQLAKESTATALAIALG